MPTAPQNMRWQWRLVFEGMYLIIAFVSLIPLSPRLKKDYIRLVGEIGGTGAGLAPDQVKAGTQLVSIFGEYP